MSPGNKILFYLFINIIIEQFYYKWIRIRSRLQLNIVLKFLNLN